MVELENRIRNKNTKVVGKSERDSFFYTTIYHFRYLTLSAFLAKPRENGMFLLFVVSSM